MPSPDEFRGDAAPRVIALLGASVRPLTFGQLKKSAGLDEGALRSALELATAQGGAFRWPDFRRLQYFWSRSAEEAAREAVLEAASHLALSQTALIEQARRRIPGLSREAMRPIVLNLVAEGHLRKAGAFSGSGSVLIRPGGSAAYAASARAFVEGKFRKAGLDPAALFAPRSGSYPESQPPREDKAATPAASVSASELLLGAVRSLQPSAGVPVTAQRLRNSLPSLSRSEFDAAALELRRTEQVFLTQHHDPFSLPQAERDQLIDGGDGAHYVSIAIR